jgi:hypothetical protein
MAEVCQLARQESAAHLMTDPVYAELMATYVTLGELLDAEPGPETVEDCRSLVDRAVALGRRADTEYDQWMAAGLARQAVARAA